MSVLRTPRSLTEIQKDHASGKPKELDDLMRAWLVIKGCRRTIRARSS
jgi:hypothetical protein